MLVNLSNLAKTHPKQNLLVSAPQRLRRGAREVETAFEERSLNYHGTHIQPKRSDGAQKSVSGAHVRAISTQDSKLTRQNRGARETSDETIAIIADVCPLLLFYDGMQHDTCPNDHDAVT
jgi:hypothetical protein